MAYKHLTGKFKLSDNSELDLSGTGVDIALPDGSVDSSDLAGETFARYQLTVSNAPASASKALAFTIDGKNYTITTAAGGNGQNQPGSLTESGNNRTATILLQTGASALSKDAFYEDLRDLLNTDDRLSVSYGGSKLDIKSKVANKTFSSQSVNYENVTTHVVDNQRNRYIRYQNGVASEQSAGGMFDEIVAPGGDLNGDLSRNANPSNDNHLSRKKYVDDQDALKLNLAGGTLTGALTLNGDPTNNLHAAPKQYVDAVAQGLKIKTAVKVASTGNIAGNYVAAAGTITAAGNGAFPAVDGVTLTAVGDRILLKDQTNPERNGVYTLSTVGSVSAAYVLTRATDMNADNEFPQSFVFVEGGTDGADTSFVCTVEPEVFKASTLTGTSQVTFAQFASAGQITAGSKMSKSGNTIDIDKTSQLEARGMIEKTQLIQLGASNVVVDEANGFILLVKPDQANRNLELPAIDGDDTMQGVSLKIKNITPDADAKHFNLLRHNSDSDAVIDGATSVPIQSEAAITCICFKDTTDSNKLKWVIL